MSLKDRIKAVLHAAQINKSCHQQKIKVLIKYFNEVSPEEFFESMKDMLTLILSKNTISNKNVYVERVLEFLAQFVAEVTPVDDSEEELFDVAPHPFLTMVIKETLKYHQLINESFRYNSCLFVKLILQNIGRDKNLDNEVCDMIQEAMLECTLDPKSAVRLQSVSALIRLQDPINADCPVIRAYLSLIVDPNAHIRNEVVKIIAPNSITVPQIIKRIRDTDHFVRMSAFRRCADIGPKSIKIIERQHILECGLAESNPKVKNVFIENLLPKWLQVYENDYINFLKGLKMDACESDITNTENITKDVINLLLNITPIKDIISILPLTEEKVIPPDKLTSEAAALWNLIVCYLRGTDINEDYLEQIIPDLTPFSNYINSIITEQGKNKMEEWEFLDYQYNLNNLFGIAEGYDLADEVGRKTLHQITLNFLRTENLQLKLRKRVLQLAYKSSQKTDEFTSIICHIISDIQEPIIEKSVEISSDEERNKECEKATLKVKIIRYEAELEDALDNQEFLKANSLKTDINQLKEKINELSIVKPAVEMVKVTKDDTKTLCDCLDILISLLQLPKISSMTPSLVAIKEEFVIPLLSSNVVEINWRVLQCLALFCILDQALAEEYIKFICIPIITYRTIPNYNRNALMISVRAVSDLYRLYGPNIFGIMEEALMSNQSLNNTSSTKRRLYRSEDSDESVMPANTFHLETIIEIILDILDDEISEVRDTALEAMAKLILDNFPVSSPLITRLILKWYNPLTARSSDKLQQIIGMVIDSYAKKSDDAKEVIAKAVKPILNSIASAPRTSPLADVDVDNLILFLATITNGKRDLGTHVNMAHMCTNEILKTKNPLMAVYLCKMLVHLDIQSENVAVLKELIAQVNTILERTPLEKNPKKNLCKFKETLATRLDNLNKTKDSNLEVTEGSVNEENKENEVTISNLNKSKRKIPNNEKTIGNLSSIVEEDDNNEEITNAITSDAKRSKIDTENPNKNNTNSQNESNTNCLNKSDANSQNKTTIDDSDSNSKHSDNPAQRSENSSSIPVKKQSEQKKKTESPNTSSTDGNDSNSKRSDSQAQQTESSGSDPVKKPFELKKRRVKKRKLNNKSSIDSKNKSNTDSSIETDSDDNDNNSKGSDSQAQQIESSSSTSVKDPSELKKRVKKKKTIAETPNKSSSDSQKKSHTDSQNKSITNTDNSIKTSSDNNDSNSKGSDSQAQQIESSDSTPVKKTSKPKKKRAKIRKTVAESTNQNSTVSSNKSQNKINTTSNSSIKTNSDGNKSNSNRSVDSSPGKKLSKLKETRNRRKYSTEQSSTSPDEDNQQVIKRVKVIVHRIDIVKEASSGAKIDDDTKVEDVGKKIPVQAEQLKKNGNVVESELCKSSSDVDVISASSNSQEFISIFSNFGKRKRNPKQNKTKSLGEATSDTDSGNIKPKRTKRCSINEMSDDRIKIAIKNSLKENADKVKDISIILTNERVGRKNIETPVKNGLKPNTTKSNSQSSSESNRSDDEDKDIAVVSSSERLGKKTIDNVNKNGLKNNATKPNTRNSSASNRNKDKDIAAVSSNERVRRKTIENADKNRLKVKATMSNSESSSGSNRNDDEDKDISLVSSNERRRKTIEKTDKNGWKKNVSKSNSQSSSESNRNNDEDKNISVVRRKTIENADKNRLKEKLNSRNNSTSNEWIEIEGKIRKNLRGRKLKLRKSTDSSYELPQVSEDDVFNNSSNSMMSGSLRTRSQTTPIAKIKSNTLSSSFKTEKGKRPTRKLKKKTK
ncbi:unnamed protein product [Psylliodes chrysocephalus]|uniref:Nuclear condensin complex subunit 3 C-terminal domain-containing protein n=1 Tax=Psylliodes chrysocephalus TaxID=3402493 RepID=A0A9P0CDN3_9CUCU|nr:unnamed protein product [Psylliodes chrysocephala]